MKSNYIIYNFLKNWKRIKKLLLKKKLIKNLNKKDINYLKKEQE